jgi:hypothetical protein
LGALDALEAEQAGSAWWTRRGGGGRLGVIGEDSDSSSEEGVTGSDRGKEEEEEEEEEEEAGAGDVPQCFSHFSYEATEGHKLVCDLQVLLAVLGHDCPLCSTLRAMFGPYAWLV